MPIVGRLVPLFPYTAFASLSLSLSLSLSTTNIFPSFAWNRNFFTAIFFRGGGGLLFLFTFQFSIVANEIAFFSSFAFNFFLSFFFFFFFFDVHLVFPFFVSHKLLPGCFSSLNSVLFLWFNVRNRNIISCVLLCNLLPLGVAYM